MVERGGIVSAKLCTLQCFFFCVQDTKYKQNSKVQGDRREPDVFEMVSMKPLAEVGRGCRY